MSITKPLTVPPPLWFTRTQVLGYATDAVEGRIRTDLETCLRDDP